jgi:UDP-glucose 4-epimerase
MRILLTGSSGWLGRYLAPRLRRDGHEVTGLDVAPGRDTQILGSVADAALVDRVFAECGIEAVIHAGALHKPDITRYPEQAFVDVNVSGTLNLLRAASAAGNDRFLFTSTTSLMISAALHAGRSGGATRAAWLTEEFGPIEPRNIYGVTKLAAEHLCRLFHRDHGLAVLVLRTGRFFPEEDDMAHAIATGGPNTKANEFLNRRLTVEDAAEAHVAALEAAPRLGFETFILSAPPPFAREDAEELIRDAPAVIARYFPEAAELYARRGWTLPASIDRVYDPSRAEALLGFRCRTDFGAILRALAEDGQLPFIHNPSYVSPKEGAPTPRNPAEAANP